MNPDIPVVDDTGVWNAWMSMLNVPAIAVAQELGIFESLYQQPASAAELAAREGYDIRGLKALLPVLMHLGFLSDHNDSYQLTPSARSYMLKDSPFFWGGVFKREGRMQRRHDILLSVIAGENKSHDVKNRPVESWESGEVDMEAAKEITAFMHSHSMAAAVGMTKTVDFSDVHRVLDVGGGSGCFSIALAKCRDDINCTVMELSSVCELARGYIADAGVSTQVDTVTVDMFRETWPTSYDTHFFSNIFHDWSFDTCRKLAQSSFSALPPGGKILLHEMLLHDGGKGPYPVAAFSLLMALGTLGQQFTLPQLKEILESAGFVNISSTQSYGYYSVVRGEKPV